MEDHLRHFHEISDQQIDTEGQNQVDKDFQQTQQTAGIDGIQADCLQAEAYPCHDGDTDRCSEQNDAEYLLAPDAMLDLAEVAMTDLRLSMPTKILCRPDCKGLCPVCGQNRNLTDCGCDTGDITLSYQ